MSQHDDLYEKLAEHQAAESWAYQDIVRELQRFRGIYDSEFKLQLPPIALRIGGAKSYCYAHFRPGHNDFGIEREVAFNESHLRERLESGNFWRVLGTLLHECLHAWQHVHGKPSSRNYHNLELRDKAESYGLLMARNGCTSYAEESLFLDLLRKHGIQVPEIIETGSIPGLTGNSKLKKWSCCCRPPVNVRVGRSEFRAICLDCNQPFKRAD